MITELPAALSAMGYYPQFIVYLKATKYPCDYRTGNVVSAHQPEYWTDPQTAINAAILLGDAYGVGFVFTEQDPFWFLDLDNCLQADGNWSPLAIECCTLLAGCAIEISQSGKGLHVFGTGKLPPHCTKLPGLAELYDSKRFVALTGTGIVGDAGHSAPIDQIAAKYFPAGVTTQSSDWTDKPSAEWRGPADDSELIRRACLSRSAASAFGNRASFVDLWEGNVEVLSKAYPDALRAYDASSADAALAQHLAFWTGNDCERIVRIMSASGLARDKYEREDYMERTVLKAVGQQVEVLQDKVPAVAPVSSGGSKFLGSNEQQELFKGCVYVEDMHRVMVPGGELLKQEQFKVRFGGYSFTMDAANEKVTKDAYEAFALNQAYRPPYANGSIFNPKLPHGYIVELDKRFYVNTYDPIEVPRKKGDASRFLDHLAKVLPDERDRTILLSYMAACVQHKGFKFQWAPLLQGVEGNGKTLFTRCVAEALGRRYVHFPKADQISKNFNGWLVGKLFYGVEDIYVPGHRAEIIEILKPMITGGDGLEIERKGVDQINQNICGNFMFNSNHKDAIRKTKNDRRFCVLFTAQQHASCLESSGMGGDYFPSLYKWMVEEGYAIVSELLHTWAIPDEFNPTTQCHRAPRTTSTDVAIGASSGNVEQEILEAVQEGRPGFSGSWISSIMLSRLLDTLGSARHLSHSKRKDMLEDMGYIYHPGLNDGRVNNEVLPDQSKPRLFVHKDSAARYITGAAEIGRAYESANNGRVFQSST